MTPAMIPGIRSWEPVTMVTAIAGACPAITLVFLLFYFDVI
jgi:hypothetical protein